MKNPICSLLFITVLLSGCSAEEQKKQPVTENTQQPPANLPTPAPQIPVVTGISENTLVGKWKVEGVIMPKGDTMRKDTHFEFREDGTCTQDKNKIRTDGNWKIINDGAGLVLTSPDGKEDTFSDILVTGNNATMVKGDKKFLLSRE